MSPSCSMGICRRADVGTGARPLRPPARGRPTRSPPRRRARARVSRLTGHRGRCGAPTPGSFTSTATMTMAARAKRAATAKVTSSPWTREAAGADPARRAGSDPTVASRTVTRTARPERRPDLLHDVDQPRGGPGVVRVHARQRRRGQGHQRGARPEAEQDQADHDLAVARAGVQLGRQGEGDDGQPEAREHQHLRVDAVGQDLAHELRRHEHRDRYREEADARPQRRVTLDVLEELPEEEEHPVHAGVHQPSGHVGGGARGVGEEAQREDRLFGARLDVDERGQQRQPRARVRRRSRGSSTRRRPPRRGRARRSPCRAWT